MPNPYHGNDAAALYLDYYGSRRMQEASVHRLYSGGMAERQRAVQRAEREVYPDLPTVRRSQDEIDAYLQKRVDGELLKRQHNKIALAEELYPSPDREPRLTDDQYTEHLKRLYSDPLRTRAQKQREIQEVFGPPVVDDVNPKMRERELKWRPPSASLPRPKHDNEVYLISRADYFADPALYVESMNKRTKAKDPQRHARRLAELARPRAVHPHQMPPAVDPKQPPTFRVYRKTE